MHALISSVPACPPSLLVILLCALFAGACSEGGELKDKNPTDGGGTQDSNTIFDSSVTTDATTGGNAIIWAHSRDTLFAFDPDTKKISQGIKLTLQNSNGNTSTPSVTDIAVDESGEIFGINSSDLVRINKTTGVMTPVAEINASNALTLIYRNVEGIGNSEEKFIASSLSNDIILINPSTGQVEQTLMNITDAAGQSCSTSGDFVSVEGLGTYVTLSCSAIRNANALGEVDFVNKKIRLVGEITGVNNTGYKSIGGLAFWGPKFYGFDFVGRLLSIDVGNARAELIQGNTGADSFRGAGVTTQATVVIQ